MSGPKDWLVRLVLASLLFAPGLWADEHIHWLERMAQAARDQSYHGSYVYERAGVFTTQEVWRKAGPNGVAELLRQTAGRNQEWLRRDGKLVCTSSMAKVAVQGTPELSADPGQLSQWYSVRLMGGTRIASRPVTVVALQPKDAFRYSYELYLDNETGLMLKSALLNDKRELLELFQFATVSFDEPLAQDLQPSDACLTLEPPVVLASQPAAYWQPAWLPPGFILGHQQVQRIKGGEQDITAQIYSDGLARFTLFVEPLGHDGLAEDLRAQLGPTVAVSRRLSAQDQAFMVTVVGEIPPLVAERIAESLSGVVAGGRQ